MTTTRDDHLAWAKNRALLELVHPTQGPGAAVSSLFADLAGHPDFEAECHNLAREGIDAALRGREAVRDWISSLT